MALSNGRLTSKLAIGLFAAVTIDTLLQLAWKTTVLETAADASPLATLGSFFANPAFFGVLFLMAIQFFNWLIVLGQADLSYVKPISSLSYASVPVFSALALGEAVDGVEITGLVCVIAGVWLISRTQPLTQKPSRPVIETLPSESRQADEGVTSHVMQNSAHREAAQGRVSTLKNRIAILVANGIAIVLCAGLAACADDRNYPSLSKITDLGSILTPQEQRKAVEELQKDQAHSSNPSRPADQQ